MNITNKQIDTITQAITEEFLSNLQSSRRLTCNEFRFDTIKDHRTRSIAKLDGLKLLTCISLFSKPYDLIQKAENTIDLAFLVELDSFPKGSVPSYDHLRPDLDLAA